jgi:hypothetical protein
LRDEDDDDTHHQQRRLDETSGREKAPRLEGAAGLIG